MSFRDRVIRLLGGDHPVISPDSLVAIVEIEVYEAPLVIDALRDAGIAASAVEEISARFTGERLLPRSTIWAPAGRRDEALAIVNEVLGFDAQ